MQAYMCMYLYSIQIEEEQQDKVGLTCNFIAKEVGDLVLAVFLLLIGQQLVNELPDHLFCWGIQHREDVHNQSVYISTKHGRKINQIRFHTKYRNVLREAMGTISDSI